jgi:hypothetical protein
MTFAERSVLMNMCQAPWRMGHGNPTPYELLTEAGMKELLDKSLPLLIALVEHGRFVFVPSSPADRLSLTIGNALHFPEYAVIDTLEDSILRLADKVAICIFLLFGATMAGLAATTLLRRGTVLDRAWMLNPTAYRQLAPLGSKVGILFLLLSAALLTSGIGWFRRQSWGWRLTVAIIAIQILGDIINLVRGDWLRGGLGVVVAGALLLYLLTPRLRAEFSLDPPSHHSEKNH